MSCSRPGQPGLELCSTRTSSQWLPSFSPWEHWLCVGVCDHSRAISRLPASACSQRSCSYYSGGPISLSFSIPKERNLNPCEALKELSYSQSYSQPKKKKGEKSQKEKMKKKNKLLKEGRIGRKGRRKQRRKGRNGINCHEYTGEHPWGAWGEAWGAHASGEGKSHSLRGWGEA